MAEASGAQAAQASVGLLRLKGFVLLDLDAAPQWAELQFAGRQGSVRKYALNIFFGEIEHDHSKDS